MQNNKQKLVAFLTESNQTAKMLCDEIIPLGEQYQILIKQLHSVDLIILEYWRELHEIFANDSLEGFSTDQKKKLIDKTKELIKNIRKEEEYLRKIKKSLDELHNKLEPLKLKHQKIVDELYGI